MVVAANRCKVLKTFISIKVTVYMQDPRLRLRKPKMPRVLNGNLVVLKWQNIHVISNIKYTTIYSKTWPSSLLYMQQRRIQNMFCTIGVLRNFAKFTGKDLCQSLFFRKVTGLRSATLLKKRLWHRSFPVNFAIFL